MAQDLSKLPRWAQQKIEVLEMDRAHWKEIATAGPKTSNTFVGHGTLYDTPLGMYPTIRFVLPAPAPVQNDRAYVTATLRSDDTIQIMGTRGILLSPQSSNVIHIRLDPNR